jgi:uncharacterized cofD-like protein
MNQAATDPDVMLEPLRLDESGPRVVALGGGHGLAIALEAAQSYAGSITAVVTVSDDGGSSGRLSGDLGIPPPGDIRRCLLALSPEPTVWGEVFAHRFTSGDVAGHSMGNLVLATLSELLGGFDSAVRAAEAMLQTVGHVIPVAGQRLIMEARVAGSTVVGQAEITRARGGIESLTLVPPDVTASPDALDAIATADQIILGPGSLYTSVLSVLVVPGIAEAVNASRAQRVAVLNLITQDGETLGMKALDHLDVLGRLGGIGGGAVIVHQGPLAVPPGHDQLFLDTDEAAALGWAMTEARVDDRESEWPQHDPIRLGEVLAALAGERRSG